MGEISHISWTDATFNPWIGCTKVSVGAKGACEGCYGPQGRGRGPVRSALAAYLPSGDWQSSAPTRRLPPTVKKPLLWNRPQGADIKVTRPFVFCASLADVFDNQVDPQWRRDLFDLIEQTPHLTWLLLTKRPQNIIRLFAPMLGAVWPRNAAIGFTAVTQAEIDRPRADEVRASGLSVARIQLSYSCSGEPLAWRRWSCLLSCLARTGRPSLLPDDS